MTNEATWKDGELAYCRNLVYYGGTLSVPHECVSSYLELQHQDALRHGYTAEAHELAKLRAIWADALTGSPPLFV